MTDKERLNTILRLRLFKSTEKELGDKVGLSLKVNHFNKQKPFTCEAFFSKFEEECKEYTHGEISLSWLLTQYKTTSKFFEKYIKNTGHEKNKRFIPYLLNYLYMGESPNDDAQHKKHIDLCGRYKDCNMDDEMNIGILLLMTYGLIPTFKNKRCQDVTNIIGDFNQAYNILQEISYSRKSGASIKFNEILCLKEMRKLIEKEKDGNDFLNRLLLIHITNDVLNRIFALEQPAKLIQYIRQIVTMDLELPRLWRCEDEALNIVWEFKSLNKDANCLCRKEIDCKDKKIHFYNLNRNEIDYNKKKIHITRYQLAFIDIGYKDFCYTFIIRPSFGWHNILKREQPENSLSFDYTDIEYVKDKHTVEKLIFTENSPVD